MIEWIKWLDVRMVGTWIIGWIDTILEGIWMDANKHVCDG